MTTFIRLLEAEDKAAALLLAVQGERVGAPGAGVFKVSSESLAQVPGSPFAYWVSDRIRLLFKELPPFEGKGRTVKQGLATADDFRFVRAWWEVPAEAIGQQWFPFAKGGAYSPFYADVHLVVNWAKDGTEIKNNLNERGGVRSNVWMLRDTAKAFFFRPGLTWPRRTQSGLALRALPAGCVFADKGPAAFVEDDCREALLAITNSQAFCSLVELQMAFGSYEVGVIQRTSVPEVFESDRRTLADLSRRAWLLKHGLDTAEPISHAFALPALLKMTGASLAERSAAWSARVRETQASLSKIQRDIDTYCYQLYGFAPEDRSTALGAKGSGTQTEENAEPDKEVETEESGSDALSLAADLLGWLVGAAFGRFDVRLATGEREHPPAPEPFDRLPICSPGMLTESAGLPVRYPPEGYPIRWPEDGILVDDPGIGDVAADRDIVRRIRQVIEVVWSEKATDIEQELCALLGVRTLRDYLRKPALFFEAHFKRYSKSKRKAPIYWPLSTASGEYTVWVYYPHLTADTLYKIAAEHVGPKISKVEDRIAQLDGGEAKREDRETASAAKELGRLTELLSELKELREELLRVAKLPYKPDLNDGVQIIAAPLWRLFRLPKWRAALENTWKALERGDYDWAHLADVIRAEQVKEKCKTDRSLAIAHGFKILYKEPIGADTKGEAGVGKVKQMGKKQKKPAKGKR